VLQLGAEQPNGRYNVPMCKIFGSHLNQERRRFSRGADFNTVQNLLQQSNTFMHLYVSLMKRSVSVNA
jgi:hypothetical protein